MFKIDPATNRLSRLKHRSFGELGFREREDLQEWLISSPDAFGEDLLIIQKEFDGFDETRERLDLLALDKNGQLVLIENKLDDSGRDLVWQSLKYAAYCSSLKTSQIIEIFRSYLDRHHGGTGSEAATIISEFLDGADLEETVLNEGNSQQIMMVAANFRKEVTATVMWLLGHGLSIQCFKVTPYSLGDELILDVQQIIPTPEAEEFMIGMAGKEKSEATTKGAQNRSQRLRVEFWTQALEALHKAGSKRYANISPSDDHWLNCSTGVSGAVFSLIFSRREARVELSFVSPDKEQNKALFDAVHGQKDRIEEQFADALTWRRMDDNKQSRIVYSAPFEGFNKDTWPAMIAWLVDHRARLEKAISEDLKAAARKLRTVAIED